MSDPTDAMINSMKRITNLLTYESKDGLMGRNLRTPFVLGMAALGAISGAKATADLADMGQVVGVRGPVPSMREYLPQQQNGRDISAGASGDLVFALNRNRGSGYL